MIKTLQQMLEDGIEKLGLKITAPQVSQLLFYIEILDKWNGAYNLTSVRSKDRMVTIHILDSLSIAPFVEGKSLLDAGTGAGLPGIPLAILYPDRHFTLLDSNGKKIRFIFQVKKKLSLKNLTEVQCRLEDYKPKVLFDAITSRALSSLRDMTQKTKHLLKKEGRFYAMKGYLPRQELSMLTKHYKVINSHKLLVPGIESDRHLIEIGSHN